MDGYAFPCPSCGLSLPGGPAVPPACPRCGVVLRGPLAAALDAVDRELDEVRRRTADLSGRRAMLLAQLRPALPMPAPPAGVPSGGAAGAAPQLPVQTTLLALGALLLSVAGTIFTVLAWGRLGIGGRAAVLGGATALAGAATTSAVRRGLRDTADAVGVLTLVLTALDLHALRLLAAPDTSWTAWWAGAAAALTIVGLGVGGRLRLPAMTATGTVVGQAVLPLALTATLADGAELDLREVIVLAALTLLGTAGADLVAVHLAKATEWVRMPRLLATVLGHVQLVAAGMLATGAAFVVDRASEAVPGAAVLALLTVVYAVAAAVDRGPAGAVLAGAGALAALLGLVGLLIPTLRANESLGALTVLLAPAALGVLLIALSRALPNRVHGGPTAIGLAATVLAAVPALERVVAGLAAPLALLGHPWPDSAPTDAGDVLVLAGGPGRVDIADLLLLGLVASALALLTRTTDRVASRLSLGLAGAAALLVPAASGLPLVLSVVVALTLLTFAVARLTTAPRPDPLLLVAVLPVGVTVLAWSAANPVLTLLAVATVATLGGALATRGSADLPLLGAGLATLFGLGLVALGALAAGVGIATAGATLATAGAATLLLGDRAERGGRRDVVLTVATVMTVLGTMLAADDPDRLSLVLIGLGIAALAAAGRPHRRAVAVLGGVLLLAAGELRLALADVTTPEAYTLPAALLAVAVGELVRRRRADLDPTLLLTPGLLLALAPSLLLSLDHEGPLRPLLLTVGAFGVVLAGVAFRLRAPLLLGAATLGGIAVRQLAPLAAAAPRWVVLAIVGLVLLGLGARYERARDEVGRLRRSFARLG